MADRLWFTPKNVRRITLRSSAVLVGKAPTKAKRIKMLCTMDLTSQKQTGFPDWLSDARDFVMKNGEVIKASQTIDYCNVKMSDENLFQKTPIEAPKARLSHMSIETMGDSEDPITVLKFQIMAPFSTDLHRWAGQMAGEEFDSAYEVTEAPETDEDEEEDEEDEDEEDDALADGEEDELEAQARRKAAKNPSDKDVEAAARNLTLM